MCGFTGFIDLKKRYDADELQRQVTDMAGALAARGPDDSQIWTDEAAGIALGFRRLAVIDLSPSGRQPMVSSDGRYVIAYNGEVYNGSALRPRLQAEGIAFRGRSDTEVLLEASAVFGVERAISEAVGMFAAAIWDRNTREITLFRDRLGIKPLYWARIGDVLFFGSQPKSFFPHPDWRGEIDPDSLASYCRFSALPAPLSIFRNCRQLLPGQLLRISADGAVEEKSYWDPIEIVGKAMASPLSGNDDELLDGLEHHLKEAVCQRTQADVPLGAFLSGGIDSSIVVALMQAASHRPVKTFSIGFKETGFDEAPFARQVANHLKTDHHEVYVESAAARDVIADLPELYDEPFADSSQIPTYLVSKMARAHVTVCLSGDGGDELFGGYGRYAHTIAHLGDRGRLPSVLQKPVADMAPLLSPKSWDRLARLLPRRCRPVAFGERLHRLADRLRPDWPDRFYLNQMSHWVEPANLVHGSRERLADIWTGAASALHPDFHDRMQFIDMVSYLPHDILTKVDRASMAVGLEARVPLIDHRVVEHSWRLPRRMKVRDGVSKWALRQILYRHVPKSMIERPKMGFGIPLQEWLRGPLKEWAADLLSERRLKEEGIFDPLPIRERWDQHQSGTADWHYPLWTILMFQAWKQHWRIT
ncbi:MAG: asparagine synthase (glutamine-hydrolyzing) [Geminicoccaceae bacterium]